MNAAVHPMPQPFAPTESQLAMAYSVCRGITRSAAKNFYYGFRVLPKAKRQALCAVYAFMRKCDDITDDETVSPQERRNRLHAWLDAFHQAHAGKPTDDPVLLALTDAQRKFGIPLGLLDELGFGTGRDLEQNLEQQLSDEREGRAAAAAPSGDGIKIQYSTFEELRQYCYGVASVVGLVCIRIFGYRDPAAEPLAERCGLAFQLTNIIRDVKEDAAMGRIYLPLEDLKKFGIAPAEFQTFSDPSRFAPLLALEADRARECYQSGEELLNFIEEDSQPALWVLVTIYRKLLEKIASRRYNVFAGKIRLSTGEKLNILAKGLLKRLL